MQNNKGGITGLQYSDFDQRLKSGVWTMDDHVSDTNYIRSGQIPNNYLIVGGYNTESLPLYDLFLKNKVSTNIFNVQESTITCIDYNDHSNLLAIGLTKAPYLKIYNTQNFIEYNLNTTFTSPINCLKINHLGDYIFVGTLDKINISYINVYNIENLTSLPDYINIGSQGTQGYISYSVPNSELSININFLPVCISLSYDDEYLCIGHYGSIDNEFNNITLFKRTNNIYVDISEYNLNSFNLGTVSSICFVESLKYLFIGSYQSQYLSVYNYERQDLVTIYDENIKNIITSKVNCLALTKDPNKLLIGCDSTPYLYMLDINNNKITSLSQDNFNDSITSISLSYNNQYLCVTSRGDNPLQVFDFSNQTLTPVSLNIYPDTISFSSSFLLGPLVKYTDITIPTNSISSNDDASVVIKNNALVFSGLYYEDQSIVSSPDLAAYKQIFEVQIYNSLDYTSTYITAIKIDGTLITNDINIPNYYYNNIIQISSYYSRIALLDMYGSVQVQQLNGFAYEEVYIISNILTENIKQIATGYTILLALTNDFKVKSTNTVLFNPDDQTLPAIKQVSAGYDHVALLTASNTVMSFGSNTYNQCDTSTWTNIKKVCCGDTFTLALTNNNDLLLAGQTNITAINTLLLTQNIEDIFTGPNTIILVMIEGTMLSYYQDVIKTL
jgi:hypothetical protein